MNHIFLFLICFLCSTFTISAQVGINVNGSPPDSKSMLDVSSTDKGFLPPRLSTVQRDAISTPIPEGLTIYNTTAKCLEVWDGEGWMNTCLGCKSAPSAPVEGVHTIEDEWIIWEWSEVADAIGYRFGLTNDYSASEDVGNNIHFTNSKDACSGSNLAYVWSYNRCGASVPVELSASNPPFVCGASTADHCYVEGVTPSADGAYSTRSYSTILATWGGTGGDKCWTKMNIGATQEAMSATDNTMASSGWYFQFNRPQGFNHDGVTRTPSTAWINSFNENSNWSSANDPCRLLLGETWRVPTEPEWANFRSAAGGMNGGNSPAAFSSPLKLHMGGLLSDAAGVLTSRGSGGWYWTSTQLNATHGRNLDFYPSSSASTNGSKAWAFPLRCIKD